MASHCFSSPSSTLFWSQFSVSLLKPFSKDCLGFQISLGFQTRIPAQDSLGFLGKLRIPDQILAYTLHNVLKFCVGCIHTRQPNCKPCFSCKLLQKMVCKESLTKQRMTLNIVKIILVPKIILEIYEYFVPHILGLIYPFQYFLVDCYHILQ